MKQRKKTKQKKKMKLNEKMKLKKKMKQKKKMKLKKKMKIKKKDQTKEIKELEITKDSKEKIKQVIKTIRYWRITLVSFLINIAISFMVNTGRTFGTLIKWK